MAGIQIPPDELPYIKAEDRVFRVADQPEIDAWERRYLEQEQAAQEFGTTGDIAAEARDTAAEVRDKVAQWSPTIPTFRSVLRHVTRPSALASTAVSYSAPEVANSAVRGAISSGYISPSTGSDIIQHIGSPIEVLAVAGVGYGLWKGGGAYRSFRRRQTLAGGPGMIAQQAAKKREWNQYQKDKAAKRSRRGRLTIHDQPRHILTPREAHARGETRLHQM